MLLASALNQYFSMEKLINIITFIAVVTFQHQTTHQLQHLIHVLLHQQTAKGVQYLIQYTRRKSIQIHLKLNQELVSMQVI